MTLKKHLKKKNVYIGEHEIDYYNSRESIGVECDYRAIVTVGLAYKPSNTFDAVTEDADESYVEPIPKLKIGPYNLEFLNN